MSSPQPWYPSRPQGKLNPCPDVQRQSGKVEIDKNMYLLVSFVAFQYPLLRDIKLKLFTLSKYVSSTIGTPNKYIYEKNMAKPGYFASHSFPTLLIRVTNEIANNSGSTVMKEIFFFLKYKHKNPLHLGGTLQFTNISISIISFN